MIELRRENGRCHVGLDASRHRVPHPDAVRSYFQDVLDGRIAGTQCLVAVVAGDVVGMSEVLVSTRPPDHQIAAPRRTAQVHTVVHPDSRDVGVGQALLTAVEELATHLAIDELIAPVLLANHRGASFYARHGFTAYGQLLGKEL
jgi:GNAT superfamily N-acetyltransferase